MSKVRYEIVIVTKDKPKGPKYTTKWHVIDEEKAKRAVARNLTYKSTVSATYQKVTLGKDAIVW